MARRGKKAGRVDEDGYSGGSGKQKNSKRDTKKTRKAQSTASRHRAQAEHIQSYGRPERVLHRGLGYSGISLASGNKPTTSMPAPIEGQYVFTGPKQYVAMYHLVFVSGGVLNGDQPSDEEEVVVVVAPVDVVEQAEPEIVLPPPPADVSDDFRDGQDDDDELPYIVDVEPMRVPVEETYEVQEPVPGDESPIEIDAPSVTSAPADLSQYNLDQYDNEPVPWSGIPAMVAAKELQLMTSLSRRPTKTAKRSKVRSAPKQQASLGDFIEFAGATSALGHSRGEEEDEDLQVMLDYIQVLWWRTYSTNVSSSGEVPEDLLRQFAGHDIGLDEDYSGLSGPSKQIFDPLPADSDTSTSSENSDKSDDSDDDDDSEEGSASSSSGLEDTIAQLLADDHDLSDTSSSEDSSDEDAYIRQRARESEDDDESDDDPMFTGKRNAWEEGPSDQARAHRAFKKKLNGTYESRTAPSGGFHARLRRGKNKGNWELPAELAPDEDFDLLFSSRQPEHRGAHLSKSAFKKARKEAKKQQRQDMRDAARALAERIYNDDGTPMTKSQQRAARQTAVSVDFRELDGCLRKFVGQGNRQRFYVLVLVAMAYYYGLTTKSLGSGTQKAMQITRNARTSLPTRDGQAKIGAIIKEATERCSTDYWKPHGSKKDKYAKHEGKHNKKKKSGAGSSAAPTQILAHGMVVGEGAAPIHDNNVGHRMLRLMGWTPGEALGQSAQQGLLTPLEAVIRGRRRGLGT
ncbi:squalene synthetase-like protein [Sorochytrium milnesiophthora]